MSESTSGQSPDANAVGPGGSDGSYTLFIADYADVDKAWEAYDALNALDSGRHDEVEGVLVVLRGSHGKLEVHKTRDHGMSGVSWGLAGGALLGVLFPPAILGSALVGGAVGAVAHKVHQPHHRKEIEEQANRAIAHSGVLAVGSKASVDPMRKALAGAHAIVESTVDAEVADEFKKAAQKAQAD
jgi:uncharacterized membrane protein